MLLVSWTIYKTKSWSLLLDTIWKKRLLSKLCWLDTIQKKTLIILITMLFLTLYRSIRKKKLRTKWSEEIHGAVILSPLFFFFFSPVRWYSQGTGEKKKKENKRNSCPKQIFTLQDILAPVCTTFELQVASPRFASERLTAELKIPPHYTTGIGALERFMTSLVLSFWLTLICDKLHNFTDINHYDAVNWKKVQNLRLYLVASTIFFPPWIITECRMNWN